MTCTKLPLNLTSILSPKLPGLTLNGLESLDQQLKQVTTGAIEGPFIVAIITIVILLTGLHCAAWGSWNFEYPFCGLPLEVVFSGVGITVCILSYICPAILLWVLLSRTEDLPFNITTEHGQLLKDCVAFFGCAVLMAFCVATMHFRKYVT